MSIPPPIVSKIAKSGPSRCRGPLCRGRHTSPVPWCFTSGSWQPHLATSTLSVQTRLEPVTNAHSGRHLGSSASLIWRRPVPLSGTACERRGDDRVDNSPCCHDWQPLLRLWSRLQGPQVPFTRIRYEDALKITAAHGDIRFGEELTQEAESRESLLKWAGSWITDYPKSAGVSTEDQVTAEPCGHGSPLPGGFGEAISGVRGVPARSIMKPIRRAI